MTDVDYLLSTVPQPVRTYLSDVMTADAGTLRDTVLKVVAGEDNRSTLTLLAGYAAGMTFLLLREQMHGEGQVEMISDGWVAHVVEHLLNGELDAAMSHLRCVGKTVDADAAAVEALQLLWEAAHTNGKQTEWTADDDRLLAECMKGGQA